MDFLVQGDSSDLNVPSFMQAGIHTAHDPEQETSHVCGAVRDD
jgi:hypothetical protein